MRAAWGCRLFTLFPHNRIGLAAFIVAASDLSMPWALWAGGSVSFCNGRNLLPTCRGALTFPPRHDGTHLLVRGFLVSVSWFLLFLSGSLRLPEVNLLTDGYAGVLACLLIECHSYCITLVFFIFYPLQSFLSILCLESLNLFG